MTEFLSDNLRRTNLHQDTTNKLTPRYNPNPYTVTERKGSMITATRNGHNITRYFSFFKRIPNRPVLLISIPRN